jgi:F-type H+-transporting ATPase subunit epsilon
MFHLEIITPDETVYEGSAASVTLQTADGEITVLPGHIPLMTTLLPGVAMVRTGEGEEFFALSGGVVEIDTTSVRVLAQTADRAEGLEEAAIEQAKARAEQVVAEKRHDAEGFAEATAILDRELAKLRTVRRHRSRRAR